LLKVIVFINTSTYLLHKIYINQYNNKYININIYTIPLIGFAVEKESFEDGGPADFIV